MQTLLFWAGLVMALTALVHSVVGEFLIFRQLRSSGIVPTQGGPLLRERHVRILWASWHLVSILGWAIAAILLAVALAPGQPLPNAWLVKVAIAASLAGSALVLFATRGRHPGWFSLLVAAILAWLGASSL
jgi:peptidoglycan/LPS O-acetylase OafA/YrhL